MSNLCKVTNGEHEWKEGGPRDWGRYHCARCMTCLYVPGLIADERKARQKLEETQMHAKAIAKAADTMRAHEKRQDEMLREALRENTRLKAFANAVLNGEYDDAADLDEQAREALNL